MLPVPLDVLRRLRLEQAIADEAASSQYLLPPTPGHDSIADQAIPFARWLQGQLAAGSLAVPQVVVSTRKTQHGVRPVPVWGFAERIAYRALVDFILRNEPPLDRSPEAYLRFISGPAQLARELEPPSGIAMLVRSSVIHYIVKADVHAFYEYVDHSILSRELLTRTGDYQAIECLMSLLVEVQGRSYGLPQLLDPSDRLSEIYIDLVERDVLRRGWPSWRFNDDFLIAVRDYASALAAIEDLATAARDVGLTLNDVKTTTPKFSTYVMENFGLQIDDEFPTELRRHEPEDLVGDYMEGVGEVDPHWAIRLVRDTKLPDTPSDGWNEDDIDLGNLRGDDIRLLRRALARLVRHGTAEALPHVRKLAVYAHSLTPWVIRYVVAAGEQASEGAAKVLSEIIATVSLSDWQRAWIVRALGDLGLLDPGAAGDPSAAVEWVRSLRHGRHGPIVRAEAALALAAVDQIEYADLELGLRGEPAALASWYLVGIRRLHDRRGVTDDQLAAVRGEGGLNAAVLGVSP
jgi:hypothetical protein